MTVSIQTFLDELENVATTIKFSDVIAFIGSNYQFKEIEFTNGDIVNKAGENSGSCKVFSFAQLHSLTQAQTLALFAEHYRGAVALNPDGNDHQNIRQFMHTGFAGLRFSENALTPLA